MSRAVDEHARPMGGGGLQGGQAGGVPSLSAVASVTSPVGETVVGDRGDPGVKAFTIHGWAREAGF